MSEYTNITKEERREAWLAFVRGYGWAVVLRWAVVLGCIAFALDLIISWKFTWSSIIFLVSIAFMSLHFFIAMLTLEFLHFHKIVTKSIANKTRVLFYPHKLIQHPLFSPGYRYTMYVTHAGISIAAVYNFVVVLYFVVVNVVLN